MKVLKKKKKRSFTMKVLNLKENFRLHTRFNAFLLRNTGFQIFVVFFQNLFRQIPYSGNLVFFNKKALDKYGA